MTNRVSRKMEYADRFALQQADQAIRKDVVRALVELITNTNDSYHRLEDGGQEHSGSIIVEIQRRHGNSVVTVRDSAEGMNSDEMDLKVGTYAEATSGFKEGRSVRGLWGRGLKDSIYGLGQGSVDSISNGIFNRCSLFIKDGIPMYERESPILANDTIREQFVIPSGNGTIVEIVISRDDVRTKQFDNLRRMLEKHFELRTIMSNPQRSIVLRDLGQRGKVKREAVLAYKAPVGVEVLNEEFSIPGTPATAHLEVFRSEDPLSTPAEEAEYAEGGLLVISKRVVFGLTLFRFESNEYAARFYGRLTCDYLHELLNNDEPVLTATRDGINFRHPFTKALKEIVEQKLEPLVEEERKRARSEERTAVNKKLKAKLDLALKQLNSIAQLELGDGKGGEDGDEDRAPTVPLNGFGFVPKYAHVLTGKPGQLTLRAFVPDVVAAGSLVTVQSDNPEVTILTPQVVIEAREDYPNVGQARVEIEGRQVGALAAVTATLEGSENTLEAEALVKVISKREPVKDPDGSKGEKGLFKGYRFDASAEPRQRVRFDRATSFIVIATKAASVSLYLDESGNGIEDPRGQVMLAELISEAFCNELASQGVASQRYLAPAGGEADAIRRKYIELQTLYAHRIHACFVDGIGENGGDKPSKKGRPSREEVLAKAVSAVN
jgi:hypothetical protein